LRSQPTARSGVISRATSRTKRTSSSTSSTSLGSRGIEHGLCSCARRDVARRHHGDVYELDELRRQAVVGTAGVHLLGRAWVQRDRFRACVDELRAEREAVAGAVAHPGPQLDRDGHRDRVCDRPRDGDGHVVVVERGGACAGLRDLAYGAAEIDVDDVGARRLAHARGISDRGRLRPEHLHRERMLVARDAQVPERAGVAVREAARGDHLRAHEACAEAPSLPAEGLDGHARHGREHDARGNLHIADLEWRGKLERARGESCRLHGSTQCTLQSGVVGTRCTRSP
jgi:hypothetical protein